MWKGPYSSGEVATFTHAWSTEGEFTIAALSKDGYGAKSSQSSFKITLSKSRAVTNPFLLQILEKIIDNFPILARLLASL